MLMKILELKELVHSFSKINIINYISVLNCLSNVYNDENELEFLIDNFKDYVLSLPSHIKIYIMFKENEIIGSGTLVIEPKIMHGFGKIGHIEDVIISSKFNSENYHQYLVDFLISKAKSCNCYKVILDEKDEKQFKKDFIISKSNKISYYFK